MMTHPYDKNNRWPILWLRWWRILTLVIVLPPLLGYVGSYANLSRRGKQEAQKYKMKGFLYIPLDEVRGDKDLLRHDKLAKFYSPVNWCDRTFFDGDGPMT